MKKGRQIFVIKTPGVVGNKFMNIPRERKHVHELKRVKDSLVCIDCGEIISCFNIIPKIEELSKTYKL